MTTARQLIEKLEQVPPDSPVIRWDTSYGYCHTEPHLMGASSPWSGNVQTAYVPGRSTETDRDEEAEEVAGVHLIIY